MSLPSRYQIGEVHKVNFHFDELDNEKTDSAINCEIVGVQFDEIKVWYDLDLLLTETAEGEVIHRARLIKVDSYFMQD